MPLSHRISIAEIPLAGLDVEVVADEAGRSALAVAFDLPAVFRLEGRYHLETLAGDRVKVSGVVEAEVEQTCVVTLEPVAGRVRETVDVTFAPEEKIMAEDEQSEEGPPDVISGGAIDLGALTEEFLALGLDPYPRKPGASWSQAANGGDANSAFADLDRLRRRGEPKP